MDHEQAFELLPGYLDQELSLSEALEFERHLAGCEQCQQVYSQHRQVSAQLRQADLRFEAPAELVKRIKAALPGRPSLWQRLVDLFGSRSGGGAMGWAPVGAMVMSVVALTWSAGMYLSVPSSETRLSQELVDNHIRSLQFNHLSDVISTDRHTVKPWFDGKLDFAPPVVDLAQQGYPLVGGRLDYLNGRPVAVMVYRYKLHPINLYVWPGDDAGATPHIYQQQGYHLAHWSAAGMNYWAITDAGDIELNGFITDLRAHPASWLAPARCRHSPFFAAGAECRAKYREVLSGLRHLGRLGQHTDGNRAMAALQVCIELRQVCRRNAGMLEYLFGHDSIASDFLCQFLKS